MKPRNHSFRSLLTRGAVVLFLVCLLFPLPLDTVEEVQAATCGSGQRCVYLPVVTRANNQPVGDLYITGVEVTQGVQTASNGVPLVAGRSTMLRIYARGAEALPAGASNVTVAISSNHPSAGMAASPVMVSSSLSNTPSRGVYASTINVPVPSTWLSGTYNLTVTIDPHNLISERNENNNTFVQRMSFTAVPALRIKIVPIRYTHTLDGRTYPAPTRDTISDMIKRLYPVSSVEISWRAPYAFSGNLKEVSNFSTLLSQIAQLKRSEGAPADQVYYALVPTADGGVAWFNGGVVGIGYIGSRVSVGLDYNNAGVTAAHEIGHNLGRYHAPCGGATSTDSSYPYASASIGEFGLDLVTGVLYSPDTGRDMMSYCSPKWISDYTYRALLTAQVQMASVSSLEVAADVQPGPVMTVRALLGETETRLLPVYTATAAPDLPAEGSPYSVQLLGADGNPLAELPVEPLEVATEDDSHLLEIQAYVPMPEAAVASVRVLHEGQVLLEQALPSTAAAASQSLQSQASQAAILRSGDALRWSQDDRPAVVRYSLDGGQTWTILAMDMTGGELDLAASDLPEDALFEVTPALSH